MPRRKAKTSVLPETLVGAVRYFSDLDRCVEFMAALRWPNGVTCPYCEGKEQNYIASRRLWRCKNKECRKEFTLKVGTVMEDSPITLDKWLSAMWMIVNAKNGVSSYEIHRALDVTQKTAWFLLHRIRLAMQQGTFEKIGGEGSTIEADETFIGGKARFMHKHKKAAKIGDNTGFYGKVAVMGLLDRESGTVRAKVIEGRCKHIIHEAVREDVAAGSELFTDDLGSYRGLDEYIHKVVDHAFKYVEGNVHTNGLENFWSLLKRCLKGTYVSVEPFHLFRYLDEETFRFNQRKGTDIQRFVVALHSIVGKRLTYKNVTGKNAAPAI